MESNIGEMGPRPSDSLRGRRDHGSAHSLLPSVFAASNTTGVMFGMYAKFLKINGSKLAPLTRRKITRKMTVSPWSWTSFALHQLILISRGYLPQQIMNSWTQLLGSSNSMWPWRFKTRGQLAVWMVSTTTSLRLCRLNSNWFCWKFSMKCFFRVNTHLTGANPSFIILTKLEVVVV